MNQVGTEPLNEVWSDDWSKAPRDGSQALLRLHNGGVHVCHWSTSYSIFGLGGCWSDGFSTMGDKIDYSHWAPYTALAEILWETGKRATSLQSILNGPTVAWLHVSTGYVIDPRGLDTIVARFSPELGDVSTDFLRCIAISEQPK